MSRYNTEFTFPIAFPPQGMADVLAEWFAKKGVKQCHIAGVLTFPTTLSLVVSADPF
jgi:bisphosphoglycerate-independent phosphoglycerate mutase (AlkP superfamily)